MIRYTIFLLTLSLSAASLESPTGSRITPATLDSIAPIGISRGTTVEMAVQGLNLAKASKIYFSEPGITGRILRVKEVPDLSDIRLGANGTPTIIDLGPLPPRNEVVVEVTVPSGAPIGPVRFRLLTPLGTSPEGTFLVEPYYGESPDKEPNDTPENAVETYLPAILAGTISRPGDADYFKIQVAAGEQIVLRNQAMLAGSTLQPVITILSSDQTVLKEFGASRSDETLEASYKFEKAGVYFIRLTDYSSNGGGNNFYRVMLGKFPVIESAFPLGVERGKTREVALAGHNVGDGKVQVKGEPSAGSEDEITLRPKLRGGSAFNEVTLAVGNWPEVDSTDANKTLRDAQSVTLPVTINGRIREPKASNYFRFHVRKGEDLILDVEARRLGSSLDSFVEVLDAQGKPIERAEARAVLQTNITLSEPNSSQSGMRLLSWTGMNVGDYLMAGSEIVRLAILPKGPDEDTRMESIDGQRLTFFDTTSEAHSIDQPVYRVQIHPPGTKFSTNGLPLVHLYFQNDDGGPGYGKDSAVHFTAPADGDYLARITDVRGMGGDDFSYRFSLREPHPDFRLRTNPSHPNIPIGGAIPITVQTQRMDGFDGPIDVHIEGLPAGLQATSGVISPGEVSTTLLLSASDSAKLDTAVPLKVTGTSGKLTHAANSADPLALIALMPKADITVAAGIKEINLKPGERAEIPVTVSRYNDFRGRVPLEVRNLPARVLVPDVGLNGVLIGETQNERSIIVEALPNCPPLERTLYIAGAVETRSNTANSYAAPQAILLKVK